MLACTAREERGGRGVVALPGLGVVGASKSAADEWEDGRLRKWSISLLGGPRSRGHHIS